MSAAARAAKAATGVQALKSAQLSTALSITATIPGLGTAVKATKGLLGLNKGDGWTYTPASSNKNSSSGGGDGIFEAAGNFFSGAVSYVSQQVQAVHDHVCGAAEHIADQFGFELPNLSDMAHGALDVLGFVPGLGTAADVANGLLYAAEGNWGDAAMSFLSAIPVVGDGAAAAKMGSRVASAAIDAATDSIRTAEKIAEAAKRVHGNSKLSTKPQHGYIIYRTGEDGVEEVAKVGISGSVLNQNGTSRRANSQVNKWNREDDSFVYRAEVVEKDMPDRLTALEWEKEMAQKIRDVQGSMPKHSRP